MGVFCRKLLLVWMVFCHVGMDVGAGSGMLVRTSRPETVKGVGPGALLDVDAANRESSKVPNRESN
jgi:hypothetical protein